MAFKNKNFAPVGGQARSGNAPAHWSYQSDVDDLAMVLIADYFNELGTQVKAGDFIHASLLNGKGILTVGFTLISPPRVVIDLEVIGFNAPEVLAADSFANLNSWHDSADEGTILETDAAGRVKTWLDKSGNGNDLAQNNALIQPVTGADTLNGLNVVSLDGVNGGTGQVIGKAGLVVNESVTVFAVFKVISSTTEFDSIFSFDSMHDFQIDAGVDAGPWLGRLSHTEGINLPTGVSDLVGIPSIIVVRFSTFDSGVSVRINGLDVGTDVYVPPPLDTIENYRIGTSRNFDRNAEMFGAEFIVYNRDFLPDEIVALENSLATKWDLTLG